MVHRASDPEWIQRLHDFVNEYVEEAKEYEDTMVYRNENLVKRVKDFIVYLRAWIKEPRHKHTASCYGDYDRLGEWGQGLICGDE